MLATILCGYFFLEWGFRREELTILNSPVTDVRTFVTISRSLAETSELPIFVWRYYF